MTTPYQQSEKSTHYLLEFVWGDPEALTVKRYTDFTQPQEEGVYASVPEIELDLPDNTMAFESSLCEIRMPLTVEPAISLTKGEPHAVVLVTIARRDQAPGSEVKERIVFFGWVAEATKNPGGKTAVARLVCVSLKDRLNVPLGIPALPQCGWTFGGRGCDIDLDSVREKTAQVPPPIVRIEELDGKRIRISGLTNTTEERYYHRGYIEVDGLRIGIREYTTGDWFDLMVRPPASWELAEPIVTPGCDGYITTCRDRWSNEDRFLGLGIDTAPAHPVLEEYAGRDE